MGTVRPQGARFALGVGLALGTAAAIAAPSSAMTLPGPAPAPAPVPAPAPPPTTPPSIPSPGPPRTLRLARGDGQRIRVSWPSGHRTVAPASTVRVRISQPRRGERKLTVSLLRVSAKGRILGVVQRTGVARGTVSVAIPKDEGRRYALRLQRGGKLLRRMTIRTPAVTPAAPTVPAPVVPGTGWPGCVAGVPAGQIEFVAPAIVRGEPLTFSVLNTGDACYEPVGVHGLERWHPETSTWVAAAMLPIARTLAYYTVPPGQRDRSAVGTLPDAQPGTYRVTVRLSGPVAPGPAAPVAPSTLIQATFEVTAPPAP